MIGTEDDDPWLRAHELLRRRGVIDALAACVDAPGSFDVALDVSKAGATTSVKLTPVTAPRAGSSTEACVQRVLAATAWPCPGGGAATSIAVRMCVAPRPAPGPP